MFDYSNLSDNEFEKLCSDVLSRELNLHLRYFSPGRDGGIDLVDTIDNNIVVQIKHYSRSTYSSLRTSLKKELEKIEKMTPRPKKYYICTSLELTHSNIKEIYDLFSDYMESDKNIYTKIELDKFLANSKNQDILKKNFKLWLVADQQLTQVINRSVFIDGEVLLDDLESNFKYFVPTKLFNDCIEILQKNRKVMLIGQPGVGKSITSKMLTFYFVKHGYQVRYTTNGDISNLKASLNENKEVKELIYIDDCFGQYYFKLKDWQDEELISLMKYISIHENKMLILNTRITIFNEAQGMSRKLREYYDADKLKIKVIDMNEIDKEEKAEIFFNHLLKNKIPKNHYLSIQKNKSYRKIINHRNYNPRIIEYVTHEKRYSKVNADEYSMYIMQTLDRPEEVWSEEFNYGLSIEDRMFKFTLFSLTDTQVDIKILEECFVKRIKNESQLDHTINHFLECKKRLSNSLINIFDIDSLEMIGVINPSVNDYMKYIITENTPLKESIINNAIYIEQLEKLSNDSNSLIRNMVYSGEILNLKSFNNKIYVYIAYMVTQEEWLLEKYKQIIMEAIDSFQSAEVINNKRVQKISILARLFGNKKLFYFYGFDNAFKEYQFRNSIISSLDLEDYVELMELFQQYEDSFSFIYEDLVESLVGKVEEYVEELDIFEYISDNIDHINFDSANYLGKFSKYIIEKINGDVWDILPYINNEGIEEEIQETLNNLLDSDEIESLTIDFLREDQDDEREFYKGESYDRATIDIVDIIFNREII
ncbi:restriction endonuclease [Bacillus sp. UMB0728]|uniref:nSTAND3 domain-containing NTPase n=1 Tax=Bacillus sp. UMB0728 TaxID=2066052 RepID=UPI000C78A12D|nr:restriction endonuclease [Bacillus sp. UMB0728]PLR71020.1 AAA family ATPase [Bacillus sp. UMB0728]